MSMDFQTNLREIYVSSQPMYSSKQENYMMKSSMKEIDLPFGVPSSSKGLFLQDFQQMDHQSHYNGGSGSASSSNNHSLFGVQNLAMLDPFGTTDNFTYGSASSSTCFDVFECKPFLENNSNNNYGGGYPHAIDNFQYGGYGLNLTHQSNQLDMMVPNQSYLPFINSCQETKSVNFVVPDEVSYMSPMNYYKKVAINRINRESSYPSSRRGYKNRKKSNIVKGQWTESEDSLLIQLVEQYGLRKWSHIAQMLPGRIGKQCRERWHNHLRPDIKKDIWTEEEDKILIEAHTEIGNKWAEIAKRLPGRTENSIKNHWNATKRRQYSKRKCRTKYPRGSILQEYIKNLNLDKNPPIDYRRRSVNPRGSMKNKIATSTNTSTSKIVALPPPPPPSSQKEHDGQFVPSDNRLVLDFDFNEVPEFCFDETLFEEGCGIDSLLDEIQCVPVPTMHDHDDEKKQSGTNNKVEEGSNFDSLVNLDENDFETDMSQEIMESLLGAQVIKKEMDLVEMISQVNKIVDG